MLWRQGEPIHPKFAHGGMAHAVGIIAVRIACSDVVDTLGQEVLQGMVDIGRMALVTEGRRKALCEANLAVHTPQEEGTEVR